MRELREERDLERSRKEAGAESLGVGYLIVWPWIEGSRGTVGVNKDVMYRILSASAGVWGGSTGIRKRGGQDLGLSMSSPRGKWRFKTPRTKCDCRGHHSCGKASCFGRGTPC